ncbi:hypothetical protein ACLOJK_028546 [Asimina triloba]
MEAVMEREGDGASAGRGRRRTSEEGVVGVGSAVFSRKKEMGRREGEQGGRQDGERGSREGEKGEQGGRGGRAGKDSSEGEQGGREGRETIKRERE